MVYHLRKKSDFEFDKIAGDLNAATHDYAKIYKRLPADSSSSSGYVQIYPVKKTTGVGKLYPNYYEKMADLDDVGDTTQVAMPEILEDYACAFVYRVKGDEAKARTYETGLVSDDERKIPRYLQLLDKMDYNQKGTQQPKEVWRFRGQRAMSNHFGNSSHINTDYIKESGIYDDW